MADGSQGEPTPAHIDDPASIEAAEAVLPDGVPEEVDLPPGVEPAWCITDEGSASWALARLLEAEERKARAVKAAAAYVEREAKEGARDAAFFRAHLAIYLDEHPPRRGKTLGFPAGTFTREDRDGGDPYVLDETALMAWAKDEAPYLVVQPEPSVPPPKVYVADLKKHVAKYGEVPPGVALREPTTTYRARRPKGE